MSSEIYSSNSSNHQILYTYYIHNKVKSGCFFFVNMILTPKPGRLGLMGPALRNSQNKIPQERAP